MQENLTAEEYAVVFAAEQTNKAPKIKLKIVGLKKGKERRQWGEKAGENVFWYVCWH